MLKIRLRYVDDEKGKEELEIALKKIEKEFDIISKSKSYPDSRGSKYSRIYLDLRNR
ncbi:MAG: hypothetical protein ACLR02_02365 [Clostridium sp.]|jgi:hypothetical protein|nr:hypothetical protein [Clostridium sp.]